MHLHVHIHTGAEVGPVREEVKLGDGKLLNLLLTWGPVIAQLFGLHLPPLPTAEAPREPAVGATE